MDPSYQNPNRSDAAYRGFAAIRNQRRRVIAAQVEEEPEPKQGKPKTTSNTKSENSLVFLKKIENKMLKNGKYANRNEHQNRKPEVF